MASAALGVSLTISLAITALYLLLGWMGTTYGYNQTLLTWALFPAMTYGIALAVSSAIQAIVCKTIRIQQVALTSLFIPGAVYIALLATLLPFVRSPIEMVVPLDQRQTLGPVFAVAFYTFWSSMIAGTFHSSFTTSC